MQTSPNLIKLALQIMDDWLGLPEYQYTAKVYLFARKLPPEEVLEAVEIAQAKFPDGGIRGLKYFCGVCWRKIEEHDIRRSWN